MNNNGGFGLSVDEMGIGHISENPATPVSIMSFSSGNVTIEGKVGIGNVNNLNSLSSNSKLFVEGGITTEAVLVKLQSSGWSDFVFDKNYKLRGISDLDQYIKVNKHLPDIPTTSEVKSGGIDLGKMNALLLQKIEELTLYIIDQQKQINKLEEMMNKD
jgi:hypothetical protein